MSGRWDWLYVQDNDESFPPRNATTLEDGVTPSPDFKPQGPLPFPCKPCRPLDMRTGKAYDPRPFALLYIKSENLFHTGALVLGTLTALAPAWRAARLSPSEALRTGRAARAIRWLSRLETSAKFIGAARNTFGP